MKRIALALLGLAACVYALATAMEGRHTAAGSAWSSAWGYVAAALIIMALVLTPGAIGGAS